MMVTHCINSNVKIVVTVIIMVAGAGNDGSNIRWSFEVILDSGFGFWMFPGGYQLAKLGGRGEGSAALIKLYATMSPAVSVSR